MTEGNHIAGADEAGCASFEATLALVDGLLAGPEKAAAEAHATACELCGPMVADWSGVSDALFRSYEDAAELAKPDLAGLSAKVLARVAEQAAEPDEEPSFFHRLFRAFRALQAPVALVAAAGAIAFVVLPMLKDPAAQVEADEVAETAEVTAPPAGPNDIHVHKLAFEDADGTVMTAGDDMTVIWITEHEGV